MPLSNTSSAYGSVAKAFHWATVLLIFSAFPVGYLANEFAHALNGDAAGNADLLARTFFLFSLHKTLGVTAFFTALLRIIWTIGQPKPGFLHPDRRAEALLAETVHWMLYPLMVLVPLSGWVMHAAEVGFAPIWWPFGQGLPFVPQSETVVAIAGGAHWLLVWTLFAVVALHVAGALKHHVIDKDATLRRMLPRSGALPKLAAQPHRAEPLAIAAGTLALIGVIAAGNGVFSGHSHDHSAHDHHTHDHETTQTADMSSTDPSSTHADSWTVTSGTLGISILQSGSDVQGSFATWSADITFTDPAEAGPAGRVGVEIDIASLTLGSVTSEALGSAYFDAAQFPTAVFDAEIAKLGEGYHAIGTLTIRDQTQPFTLPFDLEITDGTAVMRGATSLQRLDYDVGVSQQDETTVGFTVEITVELTAEQSAQS